MKGVPKEINGWVKRFKDDFGYMPTSMAARTKAAPGSPRKIEVLRQRIAEGKPLFVRGDTTLKIDEGSYDDDLGGVVVKGDEKAGAQFSRCGQYRYRLWRRWDDHQKGRRKKPRPIPSVILLNPEANDWDEDTELIRKVKMYCLRHGCAGFELLNLFGYRGTPGEMSRSDFPVGNHNDRAIRLATEQTSFTVCAWGQAGDYLLRSSRVLWGMRKRVEAKKLLCFGLTEPRTSIIRAEDDNGDERLVSQPIHINDAPRSPVTIQLPFSAVDYNDDTGKLDEVEDEYLSPEEFLD